MSNHPDIPNINDINITGVFTYLWNLLKQVFYWATDNYIVFFNHRVSYAEIFIFAMALGYILSMSRFGQILNLYNPDAYDDDDLDSLAGSYNINDTF